MGQYILCGPPAKHAYYEKQLGVRLYTAEELCFFIYHNAALLDGDFVNEQLIAFLRDEAGFPGLAERIRKIYHSPADLGQALILILREVGYYSEPEIARFWEMMAKLKRQNQLEREREKADLLYTRGRFEGAIRVYGRVLSQSRDLRVKSSFYVQVLQHMGSAYMQLGLSAEAMECLLAAWKEQPLPELRRQMFFLSMLTDTAFPKALEGVDASVLATWQQEFLESENRNLNQVQEEMDRMSTVEAVEGDANDLRRVYLNREKARFRKMIQE